MPDLQGRRWWSLLRLLTTETRCRIVKELYVAGHITDWRLWDVLGHHQSPIPFAEARQICQDLGFQPQEHRF
jgi:hypothetical protein